ncbi:hypothetical protein SUN_0406 [Sulfurovum sp. NBC37-1]|nr:hypothetical protein SUN_0406 [Sulfurovum sp. NBC37-1]
MYANQPSFDCSKVEKKSSEGLICSSDELMDIDRELATVYKQALAKASEEDMLKAHQRGWIKGRNDCWKAEDEKACMLDQYQLRIKELKEKYGLSDTLNGFDKVLKLQGITFHVQATNEGSLNQLTITPSGLEIDNRVIEQEIDGSVTGAEVADINGDGSPEIYVYVTSAGSGSYGTLVAYSANNKKSLSGIYLPPLEDDKKNSVGYMGHDEFAVIENSLARRFPVYNKEDSNAKPTGGTRQLEYKLVPGEASWQLKLVNSTTY